jgi:hypothetical protein
MHKKTLIFREVTKHYGLPALRITLHFYPTRKKMHEAERRWCRRHDEPSAITPDTMGLCKSWGIIETGGGEPDKLIDNNDIFLNAADLDPDNGYDDDNDLINIVTHEVAHAVIDYCKQQKSRDPSFDPLGDSNDHTVNDANEILCFLQGRVTAFTIAWIKHWMEKKP